MKNYFLLFMAFLMTAPLLTYAENQSQHLFEIKCSKCHSIERPKSKQKTEEEWRKTVIRMKNKKGSEISDEEAELIIKHLVEKYGKP